MPADPTNKEIRARILARRRALEPAIAARLSREAVDRFLTEGGLPPSGWKGKHVALYRALPGELDLRALEPVLQGYGARLCFPRVADPKAGLMVFASEPPTDRDPGGDPSEWPRGAFGIEEPPARFHVIEPSVLDFVFVPGVAFGLQGERMGMGGGFYDRYLPAASRAVRVALAFDFQLLPKLEQSPWDQRVDWLCTERRQLKLARNQN